MRKKCRMVEKIRPGRLECEDIYCWDIYYPRSDYYLVKSGYWVAINILNKMDSQVVVDHRA